MINCIFVMIAIIGLWVVVMIATSVFVWLFAYSLNRKWVHDRDDSALFVSLIMFVVLLELVICTLYVTFKSYPEEYGYTRIEMEATNEE